MKEERIIKILSTEIIFYEFSEIIISFLFRQVLFFPNSILNNVIFKNKISK